MTQQFRYPGVRPFSRSQANVFFGRDKDRDELVQMIDLDKITVLYSKSGLGKSSLLNAAVIPAVEAAGQLMAFSFRFGAFYRDKEGSPLDIVVDSLAQKAGSAPSFLDQIATADMNPIWFYLKKLQIQNQDKGGFLLVMDQFEELFTYPPELVKNFARRLASALFQDIPQSVLNNFEKQYKENPKFLSDEEMNLLHKPFTLKILPAIRSDRLSLLDELTPYLPKILGRLYRLDALSAEAAEEAILNPAYQKSAEFASPQFDYSDEALDYMLHYLTKGHTENIESFQLQILCQYIESELVVEKGLKEIRKEDIGDLDAIYRSYYERQIQRLSSKDDIANARKLIEEGLIEEKDQRRLSLHESQIEQFFRIKKELLDQLVETRLLRPEPHYKGGYLYELSHDSIVAPILKAKKDRVEVERQAQQEKDRLDMEARLKLREAEIQKEQRRARIARRANILVGSTVVLAATTGFYFLQNQLNSKRKDLELKETTYRADIERQNAESSQLTSMAMLEMEVDRTLGLHLAEAAVAKNPDNKLAVKVRNDILLQSTFYPFYQNALQAHSGYLTDFSISPDNKWLVSASTDSTLIVWDLTGFSPEDTLRGHQGAINDVDFSFDGKKILSGDNKGKARIWPFNNGKVDRAAVIEIDYGSIIYDVAFASNPNHILFAGEYRPVGESSQTRHLSVWSLFEKNWINRNVPLHLGAVTNIVAVDKENMVLSSGRDRSIKMTNYSNDSVAFILQNLPGNVTNMDYSAQKGSLVAGMEDGSVIIWTNIKTRFPTRVLTFKAHDEYISDVVFTPDEKKILTCSWDKTAKLWDLKGNLLKVFRGHKDGLRAIAISEDQKTVITGGEDKTMKLWSLTPYEHLTFDMNREGADTTVSSVACMGNQVLIGKHDGKALLFSKEGKYLRAFDHKGMILDVALSPDGKYAATAGLGYQTIKVWNLKDPAAAPMIPEGKPTAAYGVAFSPDSKMLMAGLRDNIAVLWDLEKNKQLRTFEGHTAIVQDVAISPNGEKALTASNDGTARLWTINGALITEVRHHSDRVTSVAFHPQEDGVFLTGSLDNSFALWKLDSLQREFLGHTSDVNEVAFSADGSMILSASADRSVRLWLPDGTEKESFVWHDDSILDAAFSGEGEEEPFIITASKDRSAKLWRLSDVTRIKENIATPSEEQKRKYGL